MKTTITFTQKDLERLAEKAATKNGGDAVRTTTTIQARKVYGPYDETPASVEITVEVSE